MKIAKRLIALSVVAIMLVSTCVFANALTLTKQSSFNVTSDGGVVCTKYSASGKNTENATVLEFNPNDGYIPMAFISRPGSVQLLKNQYAAATDASGIYGYEVAGMINASYFSMAGKVLEGTIITDGRIIANTYGTRDLVVFTNDGNMDFVNSTINTVISVGGKSYDNPIGFINKEYGDANDSYIPGSAVFKTTKIFYYDYAYNNGAASFADAGVEVVLEKQDNTELSVGEMLFGKVVKVSTGVTSGSTLAKNQFSLFAKTGSAYASLLSSLKSGDILTVDVSEGNAAKREVMNNASSVVTNIGYLVKDGVDQTYVYNNIGGHSVTGTYARMTAIGRKANGTYVFFTSDGGNTGDSTRSLTLREVAAAMIKLGCVDVVRLDGGGSTAMYVSNTGSGSAGYVMSHSRSVADTIMVVKKSSLYDASLENQLKTAIANAKTIAGSNAELIKNIASAEALIGKQATEGQLRKALTGLSAKAILGSAITACQTIEVNQFTEPSLALLRKDYDEAIKIYTSSTATDAQYLDLATKLSDGLSTTTNLVLSVGASYTTTAPNRSDAYDDDAVRLTDGSKGGYDLTSAGAYSGWNMGSIADKIVNVNIDLGEVKESNSYSVYFASGVWGIGTPNATVNVYTSADGTTYSPAKIATSSEKILLGSYPGSEGTCVTHVITAEASSPVSARYIRIQIVNNQNFTWIDEVQVALHRSSNYSTVTNQVDIQSFNTKIVAGATSIFTPAMGTLTKDNANLNWSVNVLCEKKSDGSYVVVDKMSYLGDSTPDVTLKSNQIMITAHSDPTVPGSDVTAGVLFNAQVGQVVSFYGVDVENTYLSAAPYVKFLDKGAENPDLVDITTHVHSYSSEWTCDENSHWHACEGCPLNDIADEALHTAGDWVLSSDGKTETCSCTVCGYVMSTRKVTEKKPNTGYSIGDVNMNGEIDATDYALVKRAYFGTYTLSDDEYDLADVNMNGDIDSTDYMLVKRAYFGTYTIG